MIGLTPDTISTNHNKVDSLGSSFSKPLWEFKGFLTVVRHNNFCLLRKSPDFFIKKNTRGCQVGNYFSLLDDLLPPVRKTGKRNIFIRNRYNSWLHIWDFIVNNTCTKYEPPSASFLRPRNDVLNPLPGINYHRGRNWLWINQKTKAWVVEPS